MKNGKKLLSVFIALLFILSILASCTNEPTNTEAATTEQITKVTTAPESIIINQFQDIRSADIQLADLSDFSANMLTLWFNEKTIFPPKDKMPSDDKYKPENIINAGKNPGLGVRALHEQNITGKGVNVAIIDFGLCDLNHPEYKDEIAEYTNLGEFNVSMHGPGVLSILAGKNIGTAPDAKVYFYAAEKYIDGKPDAEPFATALDMIVEKNTILPESEKIRVVSISAAPTPSNNWINGEKYLESVQKAKNAGILVLDCSTENGIFGSCFYDFDNPEDVALCKPGFLDNIASAIDINYILVPTCYRTTAEVYNESDFSYFYAGNGGVSWGIPYAAGVLAMGWQINSNLTPDEIVQILLDTAYVDNDGNKYIYPTAFIDYIKNN